MGSRRWKKAKTSNHCYSEEEVSSIAWQFLDMSEQEEDMVYRMHRLVGERWALIAGRIPGRKAVEIERFWLMRHVEGLAGENTTHKNK
ncbi:MYB-like transcription factor ETC3 isoform X1 [Impatiens glandulifera]|uniref:MYB-like transcription factor ETC3 isoform X1 n=1 Tax=Impatiens glandulifera TaxID=253017 RepID=UPI001FB0A3B5|nr:MYB-like transcription factor ETC3 isoform X1 [Impatiens glandulifera]